MSWEEGLASGGMGGKLHTSFVAVSVKTALLLESLEKLFKIMVDVQAPPQHPRFSCIRNPLVDFNVQRELRTTL